MKLYNSVGTRSTASQMFGQVLALGLTFSSALSVVSADWSQWRGPNFNGSSPEKGLPSHWSKDKPVWVLDMPGPSASTPIIHGDHLFTSTVNEGDKTLHAICLDRKTGKVIWDNKTGDGIRRDDMSNFSAPSPVVDDQRAFFFYGNGTLVAFDHAGKELWSQSITKEYGDFAFQWTFSSSPLLFKNKLYLEILQRDVPVHGKGKQGAESFILALDPATGKTLWRQLRPNDAVAESKEAYSTPMPYEDKGRTQILISGGDCLTGHDPETGKELWRWGTWNPEKIGHWRLVPSPIATAGIVLACAPKGDPIYAIKADLTGKLDDSAITWKSDKRVVSSDVPTPAVYDRDFFILSDGKRDLSRVDPKTGAIKWTVEVPSRKRLEASPTVADGKVYFMNFGGEVTVASAEKPEIIDT
ncbi:MAG TPA: PQQ-binding-like beta-propeller repeat protein, partial [Verrucomicrobiae bacterium]|nr:PQQ-binding-like beta-propeller repeat protein [Verrucomicrobiae bacterium]